MKFRNNWKTSRKQWDKLMIRVRLSYIDIVSIDIDVSRNFYSLSILNFTIKNR
jgi:hypothetical protein